MRTNKKSFILHTMGMIFCILPPTLATLEYFPIWVSEGGETMVSALTVILLLLCAIPLKRHIAKFFKSPSAWVIWLLIYVLFSLLGKISDDISAIALVAFPFNFLGALLFKLSERYKSERD